MAIPEACGLWIEQRVQEELDSKGETGASLREIGRKVAAEVEKYFETKVKPGTIAKKAERLVATKVAQESNTPEQPDKTPDKPECDPPENINQKPENRGGKREGAGRKMSQKTAWKGACSRLEKLTDYMINKCEKGNGVPDEIKNRFKDSYDILEVYANGL